MPTVDKLFAFIAEDEGEGDEGIPAIKINDPEIGEVYMPLVGADKSRIKSIECFAQQLANQSDKEIRLCVFKDKEVLKTIKPQKKDDKNVIGKMRLG